MTNKTKLISALVALLLFVAILIGSASRVSVSGGNVGVLFNLYGNDKGVAPEVLPPGRYWLGWNEELYIFPTYTQNVTWKLVEGANESVTFQDKEGTQINSDVGLSYNIQADKAGLVFQKYRKGVDEITDVYLRNMVRDAINSESAKLDVTEIYGSGKEKLMEDVTKRVRAQVTSIGINVEKIYWAGAMRLPSNITAAINSKIEATQKAQQRENELQTATATAQIEREKARGEADAVLIAAEAKAKANNLLQASITPELIEYTKAQRWNGALPQTTGGVIPMLNIK